MLGLTEGDGLLDFPGCALDFSGDLYPPPAASTQNVGDSFDCTGMPGGGNLSVDSSALAPGSDMAKLCIHGVDGLFYHAMVDEYPINSESMVQAPAHQSYYINFMGRDYAWVKQYLVDYAQLRASGGYVVVHDSIPDFHDVLCTSMTGGGHADGSGEVVAAAPAEAGNGVNDQEILAGAGDDGVQPMLEEDDMSAASGWIDDGPSEGIDAVDGLEQEQQEVRPASRSKFSIQRERISKLELRDISRYFHITMKAACKELNISETALKNVCRKLHIKRWPYRTVRFSTYGITIFCILA
ncbi:hypothetical protein EJB05_50480, partial [Eragrostis curvula]